MEVASNDYKYENHYEFENSLSNSVPGNSILIISDSTYDYYAINLKKTSFNTIEKILKQCENIENECWNAQEDFMKYVKKSDFLYYAVKDDKISGFFLVSYFIINKCCIISMDEIMILKKEQGSKLALRIALTAFRDFYKISDKNNDFDKISLMSITGNPSIMNSYFKGSFLTNFFDNTFNASDQLIEIHKKYLEQVGYKLVNKKVPFFIKNLFPGSNKAILSGEKKFKFNKKLIKKQPNGFDCIHCGDALCFMLKFSRFSFGIMNMIFMQRFFGKCFLKSNRLGFKLFNK